jgi:hypothetical protein
MHNAAAFINAGGWAVWQYIVFPWNSHQIDEAQVLAKHMGFEKFRLRKNHVVDLDQTLETALSQRISNERTRQNYSWAEYIQSVKSLEVKEIQCRRSGSHADEQSYMISYDGEIWPCCFIYNSKYQGSEANDSTKYYEDLYGKNWNSIHHHSVDAIMLHPFFTRHLVDGWKNIQSLGGESVDSCNPVCAKICGK